MSTIQLQFNQLRQKLIDKEKQFLENKNRTKEIELEQFHAKNKMLLGIIESVDSFESKERIIQKKFPEEEARKIGKTFAIVKKKMLRILAENEVEEIQIEHYILNAEECVIEETVQDTEKQDDYVLEIVRKGYRLGSHILRKAEIVIVKN